MSQVQKKIAKKNICVENVQGHGQGEKNPPRGTCVLSNPFSQALPSPRIYIDRCINLFGAINYSSVLYFIDFDCKLDSAAEIKIILSNIGFKTSGMTPDKIRKCFNFNMYLSTCDLKEATRRVCVVPLADNRLPWQNAGVIRWTFLKVRRSRMRNPLSAITASPSCKMSTKPVALTISLSETIPVHEGEINDIMPLE